MIIPSLDTSTGKLVDKSFTKEEYIDLLESKNFFPGEYGFDERVKHFTVEAQRFLAQGFYCEYVESTSSYIEYWEKQKALCHSGIIVDDWYITGDHYFYLNFLQITDKVKKEDTFPAFWDTDVWVFISIELARQKGLNIVCSKKRQIGFTLKVLAILLKETWFKKGHINKILAYDEKYVKDAWNFLEHYRNFLNTHTGWYRGFTPDKILDWKQQVEVRQNDKKIFKGRMNTLKGFSYKDNPAKPVAGKNDTLFFEESGISETLDKAYGYALNALKFGNIITGLCIIGGSVGELKKSECLKKYMYGPDENGFLGFPNIWSNKPQERVGLFIPEYYSYGDCIDKFGNSLIEEAKVKILDFRESIKKTAPKDYQLAISQSPFTLEEMFAEREENIFPVEIIQPHLDYLERNYKPVLVTLHEDITGKIYHKIDSTFHPVEEWPVKKTTDKRGAVCIVEPPIAEQIPFGLYYAGVDPITTKKGIDSESLQSVYIYKASHEINGEFSMDECVAWYTGRYDNAEHTFDICRKLLKYYNVRAAIENDQSAFIEWLINKGERLHILKRSEMPILGEIVKGSRIGEEYGFRTGSGRSKIKDYMYEALATYCSEEIGTVFDDEGRPRTLYGVNRIRDKMLLKEMLGWSDRANTDRIVAFSAALLAARTNTYRRNLVKRSSLEYSTPKPEAPKKFNALSQQYSFNKGSGKGAFSRFK